MGSKRYTIRLWIFRRKKISILQNGVRQSWLSCSVRIQAVLLPSTPPDLGCTRTAGVTRWALTLVWTVVMCWTLSASSVRARRAAAFRWQGSSSARRVAEAATPCVWPTGVTKVTNRLKSQRWANVTFNNSIYIIIYTSKKCRTTWIIIMLMLIDMSSYCFTRIIVINLLFQLIEWYICGLVNCPSKQCLMRVNIFVSLMIVTFW